MGQPVGSIFQLTIETIVHSQRCLNVLHYKVITESSLASIAEESEALAADLNSVGGLIPKMLAAMSPQANVTITTAQCIRNTRFARQVVEVDEDGSFVGDCLTPNVSAVITKRTAFSGRWAVGSFHLPGIPRTGTEAGRLEPVTYKPVVTLLAAELLENLTPAVGAGVYEPVLLHPVGVHAGSTTILQADVQDTVRVMRRRTVGLGI